VRTTFSRACAGSEEENKLDGILESGNQDVLLLNYLFI